MESIKGEEVKNVKTYKKLINFYRICFDPSFREEGKDDKAILYESFCRIFKETNIVSNGGVSFEKITLDKEHIFASICRTSDLDVLTEIKSKGKEIGDKSDIILESYTYFYVSFEKKGVSIIKTQKIPIADGYISDLISSQSFINVHLEPFKKTEEEIKDLNINKIILSFCENYDFIELKNINKEDYEISEFKIEAKLKKVKKNFIKNIISKYKNNENIKRISVSTDTEEVDLIKNIFTKQVSIELTKDYKDDFPQFEDTLKNELFKIIDA